MGSKFSDVEILVDDYAGGLRHVRMFSARGLIAVGRGNKVTTTRGHSTIEESRRNQEM